MKKVCATCQMETNEDVPECPSEGCGGKMLVLADTDEDPLIGCHPVGVPVPLPLVWRPMPTPA